MATPSRPRLRGNVSFRSSPRYKPTQPRPLGSCSRAEANGPAFQGSPNLGRPQSMYPKWKRNTGFGGRRPVRTPRVMPRPLCVVKTRVDLHFTGDATRVPPIFHSSVSLALRRCSCDTLLTHPSSDTSPSSCFICSPTPVSLHRFTNSPTFVCSCAHSLAPAIPDAGQRLRAPGRAQGSLSLGQPAVLAGFLCPAIRPGHRHAAELGERGRPGARGSRLLSGGWRRRDRDRFVDGVGR